MSRIRGYWNDEHLKANIGQTEAELTSIYLHHWVAEVDSALGRLHDSTLARQEFVDYVASLGLSQVEFYDYTDRDSDPMERARIE